MDEESDRYFKAWSLAPGVRHLPWAREDDGAGFLMHA